MAAQPVLVREQKAIEVYGDNVIAIRAEDGTIWLPLKQLCEVLEQNYGGQQQRVQCDPILGKALSLVPVLLPDGRTYEMLCLLLKYVWGWLFGITATRVWERIEGVTPHALRHTFATRYLDANQGDLRGLAAQLGHRSMDTVMIYTEPTLEDLAERVERAG